MFTDDTTIYAHWTCDHSWGDTYEKDDTQHWQVCTKCSAESEKSNHTWDDGEETTPPTETTEGVMTYKCTVCGAEKTEPIAKLEHTHNFVPHAAVPATCTTDGNEAYWTCSGCDKMFLDENGETVLVNMNGTTELPKNIVSDIAGRDIDLSLIMKGGFVWTINGMSVIKAKNVDMGVRKISGIPKSKVQEFFGDSKTVQIDLRHNGDFGFTATLTLDIGNKYNGMYANSYCYKSRKFEFGDSGEIVDGQASLRFTHASSWLITIETSPVLEDVSSAAAAHSAGAPIDMSNSTSGGITVPEFDFERKLKLSNQKRRYRILKKRRLDDLVFVL